MTDTVMTKLWAFFSGNQQISFESYTQKKIDKQMA
jgi:hypothetical protein